MSTLLRQLAEYHRFTALVVGDFMLDQHVHGAAERLSPDAPVPVLHATRFENSPGGAANVARCLRALKGDVACFGVVGADAEAHTLRSAIVEAGCDVTGLIEDPSRPTTVKRSMIGLAQHRHPQKMFRVDIECCDPLAGDLRERLLGMIRARIDEADVVCLEDYGKGICDESLCQSLIALCRERGTPILIDPASTDDYSKYRGANALTPNRSEAERVTHLDEPLESTLEHNSQMATMLLRDLDLDAVVLTLDKAGAMLAEAEIRGQTSEVSRESRTPPLHDSRTPGLPDARLLSIPTIARTVYDVTGAGDMVLAALAGAIANGFDWPDAVRFANAAAGLEVEVFAAQPIPFARVRQSILAQSRDLDGKVRALDELLIELEAHREGGDRIVLTNGCFDVIHAGHVAYLREAKTLGDVLVVAVNDDRQVRAMKGEGRPVYRESERLEILSEFASIDYLIVFGEPTAHRIIEAIRPHIYVKGGDYAPEDVNEYDLLKGMMDAGELEFRTIAFRPGLSSTDAIVRMRAAESRESAV